MTSASETATAGADRPRSDLVDKYRSLFVIGQGGMGSVEVALERAGTEFERVVALKRMLPEAARDKRHHDMFLREARLAALLSHPNVVHAFDFGDSRGELYLAMEYVEGEPLNEVVERAYQKEGRLAPALVAHILAEICDGLHAAHELRDVTGKSLNVVHRDVSPHNVMVAYEGHVKLLDFGVAKIEDDRGVTKTGEVKGKTGYMSPEQAMGDRLDRRSDLYAVGAVLFECLAGRRMWTGTDMEVIRKLALEQAPRLEEIAPGTPKRLCDLHSRLVAHNREGRPDTARDVADELRAFVAETGTRPDARVLRAVMTRLFPMEEARRKKQLTDALIGVVEPNQMATLRASMAATTPAPAHVLAVVPEPQPTYEPLDALRDSTSAVIGPPPGTSRSRVIAVAVLATLLGAGVAVGALLRQGPASPPSAATLAPSGTATPTATATAAPSTIAAVANVPAGQAPPVVQTATATSTAPATPATATAKGTGKPRGNGRGTKPSPPPVPVAPAPTTAPTPAPTTKPLDVDPNAVP